MQRRRFSGSSPAACSQTSSALRRRHAAIVGVTVAYGLWQQLVFNPLAQHGLATSWERLAAAGFEMWVLVLVLLALAEAYRGLAVDLVERRRRMRILFVAGVSAFLAAAVIVQTYNLVQATETPGLLVLANLVLITTAGFAALLEPRAAADRELARARTCDWRRPPN